MLKKMMHPLHGFHLACNKSEEDTLRANGWTDAAESKLEPEASAESAPDPVKSDGRKTRYAKAK